MDQDFNNPEQQYIPDQQYVPGQQYIPDQQYIPNQQYIPEQQYMNGQQPYVQQPYMQQPMPPQKPSKINEISPEDNYKANIYCIISLVCMFVVPITSSIFFAATDAISTVNTSDGSGSIITRLSSALVGLAHLAAWVLMIIVRVRYPKNKFGLVLMIVYLVLLALIVVAVVVLIVSCIQCLQSCPQ